ncbi:acyl-CoA thioesterase [Asticcacaulis sp. EMRT-3]|uniref:acyl-CoA thioesterase n=1 Tax=Asticcacaulis sp. EMRT-3 TaxID=3040349 RepID=UPI0024AED0F5|nr:acyl-CoA thioesterase [Asticcacaulis sp. EMRT-3]MDI7774271.1 acyl-CoA thioesterase [Asticcacaulis sp. EMRT-3]
MAKSAGIDTDAPDPADLGILTTAMPSDTNPSGDIFGGWLMSMMDLAAGNIAARYSKGRVATIAVDGMVFLTPVQVGDEVTVYAKLLSVGRTSIRMKVDAYRRPREGELKTHVTEGIFTFVAIDDQGRPRPAVTGDSKDSLPE